MPPETKPWTRHRDVVGGAFALRLNQQRHIEQILPIPSRKRGEQLQALRLGDPPQCPPLHRKARCIPSLPAINPFGGNSSPTGSESFTFLPSALDQRVLQRIET